MKLLHVDSSVLGANSVSRRLSAAVVAEFGRRSPGLEVTYRDLAVEPLGDVSPALVAAQRGAEPAERSPELERELATAAAVVDEFLGADVVVVGAPMYNFNIPSSLKAWVDRLCVAGRTFRYSSAGVEGLAGGRKLVVASSRGAVYAANSPWAALDHQEPYLRSVFTFLGVTDLEFVTAEGVAMGEEQRALALADAESRIAALKIA
ncbi:FMN-dependent NADH-azoreductase [Paludisphaera mucosa]|uniref:FMN dependent NADH:quinone oxidoreductase n=1 Tax=Paludisphaera mucosa TaxID=3030827 RepID=A0ABT6FJT2_9BACT|nr:FMN-dependent NADH-azoreductase [Paludisphaera mucosa]MDG3007842.1 FMN-dependent NADH-azoreductase [Paludisphaera mucosa]